MKKLIASLPILLSLAACVNYKVNRVSAEFKAITSAMRSRYPNIADVAVQDMISRQGEPVAAPPRM